MCVARGVSNTLPNISQASGKLRAYGLWGIFMGWDIDLCCLLKGGERGSVDRLGPNLTRSFGGEGWRPHNRYCPKKPLQHRHLVLPHHLEG